VGAFATVDENPQSAIRNPQSKGGRRPYDELLEENKAQATCIEELRAALAAFAVIPDDGAKPDNEVLYTLSGTVQKPSEDVGP